MPMMTCLMLATERTFRSMVVVAVGFAAPIALQRGRRQLAALLLVSPGGVDRTGHDDADSKRVIPGLAMSHLHHASSNTSDAFIVPGKST